MMRFFLIIGLLLLAGCANYGGSGLRPGVDGREDVLRLMGAPAMEWSDPDGARQLAYPRGPMGAHTYMAFIGADGKLQRIENVLTMEFFSRVKAGMAMEDVLRVLGPSEPSWTAYFKARDELVWEWRYCDDWSELARFDVLFDGTTKRVRSTQTLRESQISGCGGEGGSCPCGRG